MLDDLAAIGGPASRGVRKAFSHEPTRGSGVEAEGVGMLVMTGGA